MFIYSLYRFYTLALHGKIQKRKLELEISIFAGFSDSNLFREASKLRNYTSSVYESIRFCIMQ